MKKLMLSLALISGYTLADKAAYEKCLRDHIDQIFKRQLSESQPLFQLGGQWSSDPKFNGGFYHNGNANVYYTYKNCIQLHENKHADHKEFLEDFKKISVEKVKEEQDKRGILAYIFSFIKDTPEVKAAKVNNIRINEFTPESLQDLETKFAEYRHNKNINIKSNNNSQMEKEISRAYDEIMQQRKNKEN